MRAVDFHGEETAILQQIVGNQFMCMSRVKQIDVIDLLAANREKVIHVHSLDIGLAATAIAQYSKQ